MDLTTRINDFHQLGQWLSNAFENDNDFYNLCVQQSHHNKWFTLPNIKTAIEGIIAMITSLKVSEFKSKYPDFQEQESPKTIAVISAGNIPLAGFHDFFAVLISGNFYQGKLSSEDNLLLPYLAKQLVTIHPEWQNRIAFVQKLANFDKVIASGGNNSARYFDYYFRNVPLLLRQHKNSVAVITKPLSEEQLLSLSHDIYTFFGLGCRSISKIFIPKNFDIRPLVQTLEKEGETLLQHNVYNNVLLYQKTIYAMNMTHFMDLKSLILLQNEGNASPIGVLFFDEYEDIKDVCQQLNAAQDSIQCIVSDANIMPKALAFGKAQTPLFYDYPDGEDVIEFCN